MNTTTPSPVHVELVREFEDAVRQRAFHPLAKAPLDAVVKARFAVLDAFGALAHLALAAPAPQVPEVACKLLSDLLKETDRNICTHDETYRGGSIWTICHQCDKRWADDRGGFKPYADHPAVAAARNFLAAPQPTPAPPEEPDLWRCECEDDDYSRLYNHKADALSHLSDHPGILTALYYRAQPASQGQPVEASPVVATTGDLVRITQKGNSFFSEGAIARLTWLDKGLDWWADFSGNGNPDKTYDSRFDSIWCIGCDSPEKFVRIVEVAAPVAPTPTKSNAKLLDHWEQIGELKARAFGALREQELEIIALEKQVAALTAAKPEPITDAQIMRLKDAYFFSLGSVPMSSVNSFARELLALQAGGSAS